jgi:RNA polymerase sigma factor (sigma-70 family)
VNAEPLEVLLEQMRAGDLRAAERVFVAYEPQLRLIVRRQLSRRLRAKFDSVDVVQSVWVRVLRDFHAGGCRITSTAHLRNFLVQVTRNCLTDRLRHYRTALENEQPFTEAARTGAAVSGQPRPSEVAQANELWANLLALCPRQYHELLRLKRQGFSLATIAARTGLHEDSVRRIIRKLARKLALPQGSGIRNDS